ncbi:MAG: ATP synthase F1 subunit gamma [candidate division WOR-3 bacterium]
MASLRDIRKHIRSVSSIKKITRTMEMVAGARMHKATSTLFASRPYARLAWELIQTLSTRAEPDLHPLFQIRPVNKTLIILVTSDRGLCGSFNINLIHQALTLVTDKERFKFISVGKKGRDFLIRRGYRVIAEFTGLSAPVPFLQILPISQIALQEFSTLQVDEVLIVYSDFISNLVQKPSVLKILPLRRIGVEPMVVSPFIYEPSAEEVLTSLITRIIEYEIYAAILESQASEFAARMVAMKNATENAERLISDLILSFNKARQETITKELTELTTARAVIEQK